MLTPLLLVGREEAKAAPSGARVELGVAETAVAAAVAVALVVEEMAVGRGR